MGSNSAIIDGINALGARFELVLLRSLGGYPTAVAHGFGNGIEWPASLGLATEPRPAHRGSRGDSGVGSDGPCLRRLMQQDSRAAPVVAQDVEEVIDHARYYFLPDRAAARTTVETPRTRVPWPTLHTGPRSLAAPANKLAAVGAESRLSICRLLAKVSFTAMLT